MRWIGTQYAWGGGDANGPTRGIRDGGTADRYGDYNKIGFDCSGLALYAYAQIGVALPHYSGYQYFRGARISKANLQPGDLVFFAYNTSDPGTIHHVAIYAGDGHDDRSAELGLLRAHPQAAHQRLHRSGTPVRLGPVTARGLDARCGAAVCGDDPHRAGQ